MSQIILDRSQAIYDSVTYLWNQGKKKIACAGIENAFGNEERIQGYTKASKSLGFQENIFQAPHAVGDEARVIRGVQAMEYFKEK